MQDLLFLAHRIPYPPNKGDKIRSFNWLKHLSGVCNVHLGCFVDDPDDLRHVPAVQDLCRETYIAQLHPTLARLRSVSGLATGQALSLPYYRNRGLKHWVAQQLARGHIDAVLVFSGVMAQFLPRELPHRLRSVCDFVDIDSDKWQQYAGSCKWPMSWLYRREAAHLLAFERRTAWRTDASIFVSPAEAKLFRQLAPEVAERTTEVENGVDTEYFCPGRGDAQRPYADHEQALVFTGAMDYRPNIDAVRWFTDQVLPLIREQAPRSHFYIVGSRPAAAVLKLQQRADVTVTGGVHDMRPYLEHAHVAVAPLRIARGIQNKVLEAMSMAKAIVVTPEGLDGIDARPGAELECAEQPAAFAQAVLRLLDPDTATRLGTNARELVIARYAWQSNLARLQSLLQGQSLDIRVPTPSTVPGNPA